MTGLNNHPVFLRKHRFRIHIPGLPYFVTVVVYRRQPIFTSPDSCRLFLRILDELRKPYGFHVYEYVLMPDHYHAIIRASEHYTISGTLHHINGVFASQYNTVFHHEGKIFQRRFWDHGIRNEQDYREKAGYIHMNPVRAGLVDDPIDYPWSSARERLTGEKGYLALDDWV